MPDAIKQELERLIGRSLLAAESIASEVRERLLGAVLAGDSILPILDDYRAIAGELFAQSEIAALIAGFKEVADRIPAAEVAVASVEGFLPFGAIEPVLQLPVIEEAARDLVARNIVTRPEFDALSNAAKQDAFTVAFLESEDAINTVREVLAENVRTGVSLEGFRDKLDEALQGSQLGPAHLENVYRTNLQAAFHRAHDELASDPIVSEVFPYQEYIAVHDGRTEDTHLALESLGLSGTNVYRRDDPFWDVFTPPWRYQCRCGVNLLTIEAAASRGVRDAIEWLETGRQPRSESRLPDIPFRPDPNFVGGRAA